MNFVENNKKYVYMNIFFRSSYLTPIGGKGYVWCPVLHVIVDGVIVILRGDIQAYVVVRYRDVPLTYQGRVPHDERWDSVAFNNCPSS